MNQLTNQPNNQPASTGPSNMSHFLSGVSETAISLKDTAKIPSCHSCDAEEDKKEKRVQDAGKDAAHSLLW